jgi:hypothetical protein
MSTSPDRRRTRRRILAWSAPLLVASLVTGTKLVAMSGAADVARTALLAGQGDTAERAAATLALANVVETYKAPFAAGTVAASSATTVDQLHEAELLLREALRLAPAGDDCPVRLNLALVLEAIGDARSDSPERAAATYAAAHEVAAAAPAGCVDEPSRADASGTDDGDDDRTAADELAEVAERTDGKSRSAAEQAAADVPPEDPATDPAAPPSAPPPAERDQTLQQRAQDAQARQAQSPGDSSPSGGSGASDAESAAPVPAPW